MGSKKLKIITSCAGLIALTPLTTSCSNQNEEKEQDKLTSIEIVSDINDIKLEINETYTSNPIETKCYSQSKKEFQAKTTLFLHSVDKNDMDIKIQDNKICIGDQKQPGIYKYKLVALSEDTTVISNIKEFSVEVFDDVQRPDSIELSGQDSLSIEFPTSKNFEYQLIAKCRGEIIEDYDPRCKYEAKITYSSCEKYTDIYNNPIFNLEQNDKTFTLNLSNNIDKSYEGKYTLEIEMSLLSYPEVTTKKVIDISLVYATEYVDTETNYVYSRETVEDLWSLKSIPSTSKETVCDKILRQINNVDVDSIASNFCTNSGIKMFISLDLSPNIKYVGSYAFYMQEALNSPNIQYLEGIGECAFEGCSLFSINPEWKLKLKYIGDNAFKNCSDLDLRYLPDAVSLGESCFRGIASKEIWFGKELSLIGVEALYDCPNLKDVYIEAIVPPQLLGDFIGGSTPSGFKIHVPSVALNAYRNDSNWSIYSQNLVGDITM